MEVTYNQFQQFYQLCFTNITTKIKQPPGRNNSLYTETYKSTIIPLSSA